MNRIAAALMVSILAAVPGSAATLTVNTNSYVDVSDSSLSLEEALNLASGNGRFCYTSGEKQQVNIAWILFLPSCYHPSDPVDASTDDLIRFDPGVASVQVSNSSGSLALTCGDQLSGLRTGLANVRIDVAGHIGLALGSDLDLSCSDMGRPDVVVRHLVLDHAGTSGISGFGLHGATIDDVKVSDNAGSGLTLFYDPVNSHSPRRIQVKNSVFVRNQQYGIRIEALTGGPDDPADHAISIVSNLVGLESLADGGANGNLLGGIRVVGSRRIKLGGTSTGERNVISGNTGIGLELSGIGMTEAKVFNNWIGIRGAAGDIARPNSGSGIRLSSGASANKIGQDSSTGNVVSGNGNDGITLDGASTDANLVVGNTVGLNAARTGALPNGSSGVALLAGAKTNIIGTQTAKNVIAGNANRGVFLADQSTSLNEVRYNWIGVAGTILAIANSGGGVLVTAGASNNRVGPGNVISGNSGVGVEVTGSSTNAILIDGNTIGLNPAGTLQLPNTSHGVWVHAGADNAEVSGNTIARNLGDCIRLADAGTNASQVLGNWLTDCLGDGLSIQGASFTTVGGLLDAALWNNIWDNGGAAVRVGSGVGNRILANVIIGNAFGIAHGPASPPPGIAPNDALDADSGGNLQQNSPVFQRAITSPTAWYGVGTLHSTPNTTFQIDYYGGTCGADGRGEPSYYLVPLDSASVTTDAQGFADVSNINIVHVTQPYLMATATDPAGNTSQFSPCRAFGDPVNLVFDDGFESGFVDGWTTWDRPGFP